MHFYSDPTRADDEYSLPDCEVFWAEEGEFDYGDGEISEEGYYYWYCMPGCVPDSSPFGPFDTEEEAVQDCQSQVEE